MRPSWIFQAIIGTLSMATIVRADIYQWEWVNPNNPSQGKKQSTTLVPDGAGANPAPSTNLSGRNLTKAYLTYSDLQGGDVSNANLINADLKGAWLENTSFAGATLLGANFSGAWMRGANFSNTTAKGFTQAQFQSAFQGSEEYLPRIDLSHNNLDGWGLGVRLPNSIFSRSSLVGASFEGADLSNAKLDFTDLTGANFFDAGVANADFTGAIIRNANFREATHRGFTATQLYSTASYQQRDLTGINFGVYEDFSDVRGWNFDGQNLTNAKFDGAYLTGADFTDANIQNASFYRVWYSSRSYALSKEQLYSTASYREKNLTGLILSGSSIAGWDFSGQNLTRASLGGYDEYDNTSGNGADFSGANLTDAWLPSGLADADFTGAIVKDAYIGGMSAAQLYSTASYQTRDLRGIESSANDCSNWDLSGQNLENAFFREGWHTITNLSNANFAESNLVNSKFIEVDRCDANFSHANMQNSWLQSSFTGANFTGVDARGATGDNLTGANTTNLIRPNGHIQAANLTNGQYLVIRDHDDAAGRVDQYGYPAPVSAVAVTVDQLFAMDASGELQLQFGADAWNSIVSFQQGIPVQLGGGVLELLFTNDVNLATQIGRTIRIFDWTGVTPIGEFNVVSSYEWNLSKLYTTGEVTLLGTGLVAGDFDGDGDVDGLDFVTWQTHFPTASGATLGQGDADGDGDVDGEDFVVWQTSFPFTPSPAAVPEPSAILLALISAPMIGSIMRRCRRTIASGHPI